MKPSKLSRWCLETANDFKLVTASRRAALSGNTKHIVNCQL